MPDLARFRDMKIPQTGQLGGLLGVAEADGFSLAYKVDERVANLGGVCNGGALLTLADVAMGSAANAALGSLNHLPTISMTADFARSVPLGHWIVGRARLLQRTRTMAFTDVLLSSDGEVCIRASGVFRLPRPGAKPLGSFDTIFG